MNSINNDNRCEDCFFFTPDYETYGTDLFNHELGNGMCEVKDKIMCRTYRACRHFEKRD